MISPRILKAMVFGANDGIVTTFAVVAGVAGAKLSVTIVLIMGIANLMADGLSMGLGDYLGAKSELRLERLTNRRKKVKGICHTGVVTFVAFLIAGSMPLLPYYMKWLGVNLGGNDFLISIVATLGTLFLVGSARSLVTRDNWLRNGVEMLAIGSLAAGVAYGVGAWIKMFL